MATTLIIVRHGESEANGSKRFAGHLDIPLSAKGLKQAELTAGYIKENYHVDAVYASDLQRAYHTALPIAQAFDLEVTKTEHCFGITMNLFYSVLSSAKITCMHV